MKDRIYKKGLFTSIGIILVIAAVIAVNILVTLGDFSMDLTEEKIYSLSDQTKSILKDLDQDVDVYIINEKTDVNEAYARIWKEYRKASPRIHLKYRSQDSYPNFARKYAGESEEIPNDSAVVVCGKKYRYLSADDYVSYTMGSDYSYNADSLVLESKMTEAINYVTADVTPKIYQLTGHSEADLTASVVSALQGDNYELNELSLLKKKKVPKDCELLIINGPQKDLSKEERKRIEKYMDRGGKMYIFLDAAEEKLKNLNSLLEDYGIDPQKGVVVETDPNLDTQYPIYLLPDIEDTEVTKAQYDSNVFVLTPSAKGLKKVSDGKKDKKDKDKKDKDEKESKNKYTVTPLLTSSEESFSKVDTNSSTIDKEKGDIDGPFAIAAAVSDESGGRLIVTGCANMLDDNIDQAVSGANKDFFLNGVNYLTKQESKISIRAKSLATETVTVPAFAQKMALITTVFVIPGLLLLAGIIVVVRRRRL